MLSIQQHTPRPFSLLIKPASADCNLRCDYCFYAKKAMLYPADSVPRMTDTVLSRLIQSYMHTTQPQYTFGWQGGEPTLMGLDFFRRVIDLQMKHGKDGDIVANALQTNGTLLDDDWARFLAANNFLVGLSIDGPAVVHDQYRKYRNGRSSHREVMRAVATLQRHQVQFNALVLVNNISAGRGREIYCYLRDQGVQHHQYIECAEFSGDGRPLPVSIAAEQWGDFLCEIFDEWLRYDTRLVSVRLFDSILSALIDQRQSECRMAGNCCQYFVIECNGDVFPCDFFVEPELKIGNIMSDSWSELQQAKVYQQFGRRKAAVGDACESCPFRAFCQGDCLKHRKEGAASGRKRSWFCKGWQMFYRHSLPALEKIAKDFIRNRDGVGM